MVLNIDTGCLAYSIMEFGGWVLILHRYERFKLNGGVIFFHNIGTCPPHCMMS
jgi:hypothetical protein